ncbi:hypothetical protein BC832DRAFT_111991 [Gaertneriomyces semiglobifer]|nr:hypothetical protein BC832DRAFT_111991 [Gaertneriomyces semiglobifer]
MLQPSLLIDGAQRQVAFRERATPAWSRKMNLPSTPIKREDRRPQAMRKVSVPRARSKSGRAATRKALGRSLLVLKRIAIWS